MNVEYQHKLKSVTKDCPLFIHFDHKYVSYSIFHVKLLPSQPIFMYLEYKNDHTYFLAFTATAFLNYFKFANKHKILPF